MAASFVDTNVIIYLMSNDVAKAEQAEAVLAQPGVVISVQVLNEIANVAQRKMKLSWAATHEVLTTIRELVDVHPMTVEVHETGLALAQRYRLSTYDAMIAASALTVGCETLWSEDMHDGLVIEGRLKVINPFLADAD